MKSANISESIITKFEEIMNRIGNAENYFQKYEFKNSTSENKAKLKKLYTQLWEQIFKIQDEMSDVDMEIDQDENIDDVWRKMINSYARFLMEPAQVKGIYRQGEVIKLVAKFERIKVLQEWQDEIKKLEKRQKEGL